MGRVDVLFSNGQLRQPGLWGKVLNPKTGSIMEYGMEKGVELTVHKTTRTIAFPELADDLLLVFGAKGYFSAGQLVSCFLLFRVKSGAQADCQFTGHLARFEGKGLELLAKSETDLQPIYAALKQASYAHVDRLQDILRKESIDKSK